MIFFKRVNQPDNNIIEFDLNQWESTGFLQEKSVCIIVSGHEIKSQIIERKCMAFVASRLGRILNWSMFIEYANNHTNHIDSVTQKLNIEHFKDKSKEIIECLSDAVKELASDRHNQINKMDRIAKNIFNHRGVTAEQEKTLIERLLSIGQKVIIQEDTSPKESLIETSRHEFEKPTTLKKNPDSGLEQVENLVTPSSSTVFKAIDLTNFVAKPLAAERSSTLIRGARKISKWHLLGGGLLLLGGAAGYALQRGIIPNELPQFTDEIASGKPLLKNISQSYPSSLFSQSEFNDEVCRGIDESQSSSNQFMHTTNIDFLEQLQTRDIKQELMIEHFGNKSIETNECLSAAVKQLNQDDTSPKESLLETSGHDPEKHNTLRKNSDSKLEQGGNLVPPLSLSALMVSNLTCSVTELLEAERSVNQKSDCASESASLDAVKEESQPHTNNHIDLQAREAKPEHPETYKSNTVTIHINSKEKPLGLDNSSVPGQSLVRGAGKISKWRKSDSGPLAFVGEEGDARTPKVTPTELPRFTSEIASGQSLLDSISQLFDSILQTYPFNLFSQNKVNNEVSINEFSRDVDKSWSSLDQLMHASNINFSKKLYNNEGLPLRDGSALPITGKFLDSPDLPALLVSRKIEFNKERIDYLYDGTILDKDGKKIALSPGDMLIPIKLDQTEYDVNSSPLKGIYLPFSYVKAGTNKIEFLYKGVLFSLKISDQPLFEALILEKAHYLYGAREGLDPAPLTKEDFAAMRVGSRRLGYGWPEDFADLLYPVPPNMELVKKMNSSLSDLFKKGSTFSLYGKNTREAVTASLSKFDKLGGRMYFYKQIEPTGHSINSKDISIHFDMPGQLITQINFAVNDDGQLAVQWFRELGKELGNVENSIMTLRNDIEDDYRYFIMDISQYADVKKIQEAIQKGDGETIKLVITNGEATLTFVNAKKSDLENT